MNWNSILNPKNQKQSRDLLMAEFRRWKVTKVLVLIPCFGLAGCSTLATVFSSEESFQCDEKYTVTRVYSGVSNDIRFLRGEYQDKAFVFWDFPFSLVADTVLLPYTVVTQITKGNLCEQGTPYESE